MVGNFLVLDLSLAVLHQNEVLITKIRKEKINENKRENVYKENTLPTPRSPFPPPSTPFPEQWELKITQKNTCASLYSSLVHIKRIDRW